MKVFGSPEGAPRRPWGTEFSTVLVWAGIIVFIAGVQWPYLKAWVALWFGLGASLVRFAAFRVRQLDAQGWYEKKEMCAPSLPFRLPGSAITFGPDALEVAAFFRRRTSVPYAAIRRVSVVYQGVHLHGVHIARSEGACPADKDPMIIDEREVSGEMTRLTLAILRDKAPHAIFEGPQWLLEGWVPRTGFTTRNRDAGA